MSKIKIITKVGLQWLTSIQTNFVCDEICWPRSSFKKNLNVRLFETWAIGFLGVIVFYWWSKYFGALSHAEHCYLLPTNKTTPYNMPAVHFDSWRYTYACCFEFSDTVNALGTVRKWFNVMSMSLADHGLQPMGNKNNNVS